MLCAVCSSIDLDKALCSPEFGGTPLQTYKELKVAAWAGCELCLLIRNQSKNLSRKPAPTDDGLILACVWNWYEGLKEHYRGSAVITFFQRESSWSVVLGIFVEKGVCFI